LPVSQLPPVRPASPGLRRLRGSVRHRGTVFIVRTG